MSYDTSKLIGPIVGAAGAAIGIGILAKTAQNVSRMMDDHYKRKGKKKKTKFPNYWGYK